MAKVTPTQKYFISRYSDYSHTDKTGQTIKFVNSKAGSFIVTSDEKIIEALEKSPVFGIDFISKECPASDEAVKRTTSNFRKGIITTVSEGE